MYLFYQKKQLLTVSVLVKFLVAQIFQKAINTNTRQFFVWYLLTCFYVPTIWYFYFKQQNGLFIF